MAKNEHACESAGKQGDHLYPARRQGELRDGTPQNIAFWIVAVVVWIGLFAVGIMSANTSVLPGWFTSNAFNFPLNTVTTLAELYIGFLVAAAANQVGA